MSAYGRLKKFEKENGIVGSAQLSMSFTTDSDLAHDLLKEVRRVGRARQACVMQKVKDGRRNNVVLFLDGRDELTDKAIREWRRLDRAAAKESDG